MKNYFILAIVLIMLGAIVQAQQTQTPSDQIPELVREINQWRLDNGLEPVVYDSTLEALAVLQADYLVSLPSLPANFHAGPNGENERDRSQLEDYSWSVYGNPLRISVTEIAAIGSIRSAMTFWTSSDIHTRSALNPAYREVGIAAREFGRDTLFIVVFGGRPDVLPALADPETDNLYLTTERSEYANAGDWISAVEKYRFLDANEMPITDWQSWEPVVPLPNVNGDFFYVQYEDANRRRVTTKVSLMPVWSSADHTSVQVVQDDNSIADTEIVMSATENNADEAEGETSNVFVTLTPLPSATSVPTFTPVPPTATSEPMRSVQLVYDEAYFTLVNTSGDVANLFDIQFRNGDKSYSGFAWEQMMNDLNIGALPANHCLQIGGFSISSNVLPLSQCRWIRSFVTISEEEFFWTRGEFEVLIDGSLVATCQSADSTCEIVLSQ